MLADLLTFVSKPGFIHAFLAISSDPVSNSAWSSLYKNIFIRFLLIFIIIYQNTTKVIFSIIISLLTMIFFYLISNKKEREEVLSNNLKTEDFKTFGLFCLYIFTLNQVQLLVDNPIN